MGIDRVDDEPVAEATLERAADRDSTRHDVSIAYETRDRAVYYQELQAAVAAERGAPDNQWGATVQRFSDLWAEHTRKWPRDTHPDDSRHLDTDANDSVDRGCERIREIEENVITPAMLRIEAEDPTRKLVGFDHRLKGPDRIKEKVAGAIEERGRTPEEALASVKDAIRYTFQYDEQKYTLAAESDMSRLKSSGFELVELRNSWSHDEYKGINSRWREQDSGQLFEVQFHTTSSFNAKQLTHTAYERIRNPDTPRAEVSELRDLQRQVWENIAIPSDSIEIPNYPGKRHDAS